MIQTLFIGLTRVVTRPQRWMWGVYLLALVTMACASNTSVARVGTARPTRTPIPTFTNTPIPPSATPVPTATETSTPTETPIPTNTPVPPTNTPVPNTDTPVPTNTPVPKKNTPVPPTNTPVPPTNTPKPQVVAQPVSPVSAPTNTPVPSSPAGLYKPTKVDNEANCAHVGVKGIVRSGDDDDDAVMTNVTIKITGDKGGFEGPYYGTTDGNGNYGIVIGEFGKVSDDVEFRAIAGGSGVKTANPPRWKVSDDCHEDDANQVMVINWAKIE